MGAASACACQWLLQPVARTLTVHSRLCFCVSVCEACTPVGCLSVKTRAWHMAVGVQHPSFTRPACSLFHALSLLSGLCLCRKETVSVSSVLEADPAGCAMRCLEMTQYRLAQYSYQAWVPSSVHRRCPKQHRISDQGCFVGGWAAKAVRGHSLQVCCWHHKCFYFSLSKPKGPVHCIPLMLYAGPCTARQALHGRCCTAATERHSSRQPRHTTHQQMLTLRGS